VALVAVDALLANPQADASVLLSLAQLCNQLNQLPRVEQALGLLVKLSPDNPEAWFDFAGVQAINNKQPEAIASLRTALQLSNKRLAQTTNAANLYTTAQTDQRFAAVRQSPEFQKLMTEVKPAGK
jgi:predicted Zn-dependent protease